MRCTVSLQKQQLISSKSLISHLIFVVYKLPLNFRADFSYDTDLNLNE